MHVARTLKLGSASVQPIDPATRAVACPPPTACNAEVVVTVAEMEMNRSPITIWTTVLKKRRSSGRSITGRLASATPITMAAISPVSSRLASLRQKAAACPALAGKHVEPVLWILRGDRGVAGQARVLLADDVVNPPVE